MGAVLSFTSSLRWAFFCVMGYGNNITGFESIIWIESTSLFVQDIQDTGYLE